MSEVRYPASQEAIALAVGEALDLIPVLCALDPRMKWSLAEGVARHARDYLAQGAEPLENGRERWMHSIALRHAWTRTPLLCVMTRDALERIEGLIIDQMHPLEAK